MNNPLAKQPFSNQNRHAVSSHKQETRRRKQAYNSHHYATTRQRNPIVTGGERENSKTSASCQPSGETGEPDPKLTPKLSAKGTYCCYIHIQQPGVTCLSGSIIYNGRNPRLGVTYFFVLPNSNGPQLRLLLGWSRNTSPLSEWQATQAKK